MKFRLAFLAATLAATPAIAQDGAEDEAFRAEIERQERLDETVIAVDRLLDAVLDMPVGSLARALPPETTQGVRIAEGDTLRDVGTRRDPAFEENVRGGARAMTAVLGTMMSQFQTMMPELERWGGGVGEALED